MLLQDRRRVNQQQLSGDFNAIKHSRNNQGSSKNAADSPPRTTLEEETYSKTASDSSVDPNILIKREPVTEECQSSPSKAGAKLPPFAMKNESQSHLELKQRLSQTIKSDATQWSSLNGGTETTQDELKLTAYDVIAGVISTHPIQPLEKDTDNASTNSHKAASSSSSSTITSTSGAKAGGGHTPRASVTTPTTSSTQKNTNDQLALVQDLDDFFKVMHQVTQEQKAKERRNSLPDPLEPSVYPGPAPVPRLLDPPPYLAIRQSRPLDLPLQSSSTYYQQQHKYSLPHSHSQVDSTYNSKSIKSQLVLPTGQCVLSDPLSSNLPATPTTPLEHFSAFHSPPAPPPHLPLRSPVTRTFPPTHLPLGPPQSPATQCPPPPHLAMPPPESPVPRPPPYSSCYPFTDAMHHQTLAASSSGEGWSLPGPRPTQRSVLPDTATREHKMKGSALSHVTLAGQKRPIQELNGSVLPPAKLHDPQHSITSAGHRHSVHGYPTSLPLPPYHTSSAPSLTFPH